MKYSGYMILSDFDGTLSNDGLYLRDNEKEAIRIFTREGGLFGIATGRSREEIRQIFRGVDINAPCVFLNGAVIADVWEERVLKEWPLLKDIDGVIKEVEKNFHNIAIQGQGIKQQYLLCAQGDFTLLTKNFIEFLQVQEEKMTETKQILNNLLYRDMTSFEEIGEPLYKVVIMADTNTIEKIRKYLQERFVREKYMISASAPFNIEITALGASKGQAGLYIVKNLYKQQRLKWIALGDEENDVDALQNAYYSFAPGEAESKVGAYADKLLDSRKGMVKQVLEFLEKDF